MIIYIKWLSLENFSPTPLDCENTDLNNYRQRVDFGDNFLFPYLNPLNLLNYLDRLLMDPICWLCVLLVTAVVSLDLVLQVLL